LILFRELFGKQRLSPTISKYARITTDTCGFKAAYRHRRRDGRVNLTFLMRQRVVLKKMDMFFIMKA
jgi:hypothetical protein